jgi:hypothetical protein
VWRDRTAPGAFTRRCLGAARLNMVGFAGRFLPGVFQFAQHARQRAACSARPLPTERTTDSDKSRRKRGTCETSERAKMHSLMHWTRLFARPLHLGLALWRGYAAHPLTIRIAGRVQGRALPGGGAAPHGLPLTRLFAAGDSDEGAQKKTAAAPGLLRPAGAVWPLNTPPGVFSGGVGGGQTHRGGHTDQRPRRAEG